MRRPPRSPEAAGRRSANPACIQRIARPGTPRIQIEDDGVERVVDGIDQRVAAVVAGVTAAYL